MMLFKYSYMKKKPTTQATSTAYGKETFTKQQCHVAVESKAPNKGVA